MRYLRGNEGRKTCDDFHSIKVTCWYLINSNSFCSCERQATALRLSWKRRQCNCMQPSSTN